MQNGMMMRLSQAAGPPQRFLRLAARLAPSRVAAPSMLRRFSGCRRPPQQLQLLSGCCCCHSQAADPLASDDWCQRSRLLVGDDALQRLAALNVLLVGLGGVGSFVAEFLARAGVGSMTLVDGDTVDTTNRNRQLPALRSTVGDLKTEVVAARLRDINPQLQLTLQQEFLDPMRAAALVQQQAYDYVIDAIDSLAPKAALLLAGHAAGVPTISAMGAGGRLDPARVRLADISETHGDAFAAVVRRGLRRAGVSHGITVVFSDEPARPASLALTQQQYKKSYYGTSSYLPGLFGLYMASHVIRQVVEGDAYKLQPLEAPGVAEKARKQQERQRQRQRQQQQGGNGSRSSSSRNSSSRSSSIRSSSIRSCSIRSSSRSERGSSSSRSVASTAPADASAPLQASVVSPPPPPSQSPSGLFSSHDRCQGGVGIGYDGEGI